MVDAVREFDKRTAAGILSRLALALEPPPGRPIEPPEGNIERQVLSELRETLQLDPADQSPDTVGRLVDALDEEAARIAGIEPDDTTTQQLSKEGLLPSDLYRLTFDTELAQRHGKHWDIEKRLTEITVHSPHREQNFSSSTFQSARVSLFARYFTHKYPVRSFWMLVSGIRHGIIFDIAQILRVYPQDVDLTGSADLLDMLQAFVKVFGVDIELDGVKDRFFHTMEPTRVNHVRFPQAGPKEVIAISGIRQRLDGSETIRHLVFAFHFTKYIRAVQAKHGFDPNLFELIK
jgi:hypothetical protein